MASGGETALSTEREPCAGGTGAGRAQADAATESAGEDELRLRGIVEQSFDGIALVDEDGLVIEWNPAQARIYGLPRGRAVGRPLWDLQAAVALNERLAIVQHDQMKAMLQDFLRTGEAPWLNRLMEWRVRRSDGSERTVQQIMFAIRTARGFRAGSVTRDVTERLETEQQLQATTQTLKALLDSAPIGIVGLDAEGRVRSWNRAAEHLLGLPLAEVVGSPPPYATEGNRAAMGLTHGTGGAVGAAGEEVEHRRPDGSVVHLSLRTAPLLDPLGRLTGYVTSIADVTERRLAEEERRHLEEQVRRAQKLESLGVLAGGIAHDFNNLLVAILGNADLAMMDLPASSPVRELVADIRTSAMRAADLSRQMLTYSGRAGMARQHFDVNQVVRRASHSLSVIATHPELLQLRLMAGLPQVLGDPSQVGQVVANLLTNAIDALRQREGAVTVSTGLIGATAEYLAQLHLGEGLAAGQYVSIEVRDTGCGMDEDTLKRIFDPFFSTKQIGRGLGLPVVQGVISAHRGAIEVGSAPGAGSTFRVLLPASAEDVSQEAAEAKAPSDILVVDDEAGIRTIAKRVLEREGYTVLTASDGVEGVEVFRQHADDVALVLLDLTMPRLAGEEACRAIHAIRADVPVLLLSGYSEQTARASFADLGIAGFLQKPFSTAELCARVEEAIRGTAPRQA